MQFWRLQKESKLKKTTDDWFIDQNKFNALNEIRKYSTKYKSVCQKLRFNKNYDNKSEANN